MSISYLSLEYKCIAKSKCDARGKQKESLDIKRPFEDIFYHTRHLKGSTRVEDPFNLLDFDWAPEDCKELKLAAYLSLWLCWFLLP